MRLRDPLLVWSRIMRDERVGNVEIGKLIKEMIPHVRDVNDNLKYEFCYIVNPN
jgi:hypothetical protein